MSDSTGGSLIERLRALPRGQVWLGRPADPQRLSDLEREYGVTFPDDYRQLKLAADGVSLGNGGSRLELENISETYDHLGDEVLEKKIPGMIVIGSDGGGMAYYYDPKNRLGKGAFAVFMVSFSALFFAESIYLGKSLTEVIERVLGGEELSELPQLGPGVPNA
jgi:hypothetical protein